MPQVRANGVDLYYELVGEGDPLVWVHGSWNDHTSWKPAIEADMRASFTVVAYDRRGHGRSETVPGQGTRRQDEDDLAALIEQLGLAPVHAAGNSFGASIVLALAARRPELFLSLTLHEPPLIAVVADEPESMRELQPTMISVDAAMDHLRKGENEQGARLFVEEIALGPGMWDQLPEDFRGTLVTHAPHLAGRADRPRLGHARPRRTRRLHHAGVAEPRVRESSVVLKGPRPAGRSHAPGKAADHRGGGAHPPHHSSAGVRGRTDRIRQRSLILGQPPPWASEFTMSCGRMAAQVA
ncbi:alpha/beta hydrolase [Streptomyces sp. AP-93]|nr:alpha/beta hydrolase [Streptomyces sp. AP-93]MCJ0873866.1 alpha/beta hydrolase [Streptomyces sp. AP-93]